MKKFIKNLDELMEVELSVKSKGDGVEIRVKGTNFMVKGALASLVAGLIKESNLTEDDIREAVEDGLKDDEKFKEELEELELKFDEEMEDFIKKLKEMIEEK